jgi:hypothetical protein
MLERQQLVLALPAPPELQGQALLMTELPKVLELVSHWQKELELVDFAGQLHWL